MNKLHLPIAFCGILASMLLACETRKTTSEAAGGESRDTAVVISKETRTSRELEEFKDWVNARADQTDSSVKEKWPEVKEGFKQRTARLDSQIDSLSAESKAEYQELKSKFESWEARQQRRTSQPLDPAQVKQWEKKLLGNKKPESIAAADMREMYLTFMGVVRAQKQRWTQNDWDYVDHVYSRLNDRRRQVESDIPASDQIKIRTLQAEYLVLEAGSDAKDLYQHVKK